MQAPVLTKNQSKRAIGKKVPKKKSVRNVLSRPKTFTWPLITENTSRPLLTNLKELISHKHDINVNWNTLKDAPREKRKEERTKIENKLGKEKRPQLLQSVVFGINAVTRGLEKNLITSVIITADVNPIEMVRHIWHSCVNSKIPVITVPYLRLNMKMAVGIPCVIMGFKEMLPVNPLYNIHKMICELSKNFANPSFLDNSESNEDTTKQSEIDNTVIDLDDTIIEIDDDTVIELNDTTIIEQKDHKCNLNTNNDKNNIYLYRTDVTKRCFIPPQSKINNDLNFDLNSDFISFGENMDTSENISNDENDKINSTKTKQNIKNSESITVHCVQQSPKKGRKRRKKNSSQYLPLNIKQIQSNPDRKKN